MAGKAAGKIIGWLEKLRGAHKNKKQWKNFIQSTGNPEKILELGEMGNPMFKNR